MNNTKSELAIIPLGIEAHRLAEQFATQQAVPEKRKRVYLNTLAVYAVHRYLSLLQFETALEQSDSWHPVMQTLFDVADLVLPEIGKLDCIPVLPGETAFNLPWEATEKIAYVAVQFGEILSLAEILGFFPATAVDADNPPEQIQISSLQSLETLIDYIYDARKPITPVPLQEVFVRHQETLVNLSQWFQNVFETAWQTIDQLLSPTQLSLAFSSESQPRSSSSREIDDLKNQPIVRRAKAIDLGIELAGYAVTLVIELTPETNEQSGIRLRVFPSGNQTYLPPNLQLTVLDNSGESILEATSRALDNWIQLQFKGHTSARFSVRLVLGNACIAENFII